MMRVGVISDTHGRLSGQAFAALADCDHIVHAGDIGGPHVLRDLAALAPVSAVLGNNDFAEYGSEVGRYTRPVLGGVRFLVSHYPRSVELRPFASTALAPGDPIPDICIHGHTHLPRLEWGADARPAGYILNPGSASFPRGGFPASIAVIAIEEGEGILGIRVESLAGEPILSVGHAV